MDNNNIDSLLPQPIWGNQLIKLYDNEYKRKTCILFKKWVEKGFIYFKYHDELCFYMLHAHAPCLQR